MSNALPATPSASPGKLARQTREHLLQHILPFWSGPALDREQGGWMGWLSNDLQPDRTQSKSLILNTRILWTFSAAHAALQEGLHHDLADRALEWVMEKFWDDQHGGAVWRLDDTGKVIDDSKQIYGQAFYLYALAQYHLAFGSPTVLTRAKELFGLLDCHAHDSKAGGYFEVRGRNWSANDAESHVGGRELNATKSMNTNLHVLEALSTLYRAWPDPKVADRLREMIRVFRQHILDPRTLHFHHYFDDDWKVLSHSYTFGHDIEGSWLLCEAAEVLGDQALRHEVEALAVRMARVTLKEGMAEDGALRYEAEAGRIVDAGKEWWPQAEAVVGFLNAWQISRDPEFLVAANRLWAYIERHLVDREHGDWFWRINPDGKIDPAKPKVSEWKGPYHSGRACLETMRRLKKYSTD